jgi:hypothetical protein
MLGPKSRLGASRLTAPEPQATLPAGHAAGGRGAVTPGRQLWRGPWRRSNATTSWGITTRRAPLPHTSRSRSRRPRAQARRLDPVNCRPAGPTSDGQRYGETAEVARRYPVLLTYPSVARRDMSGPASSRCGQNRPRGTAVVPTATSNASKQSTTGDDGDGGDAAGRMTHAVARLGAERSSVQIRPPRLAGRPLPKRASDSGTPSAQTEQGLSWYQSRYRRRTPLDQQTARASPLPGGPGSLRRLAS